MNEIQPADKLAILEQAILALPMDCPVDSIAELLDRVSYVKQKIRHVDALLEDKMLCIIEERGDITVGTIRFYEGEKNTTKANSNAEVFDRVLQLSGGDLDIAFRDYMAASPFKYSAIKAAIPKHEFNALFTVTAVPELREGKPVRRLMKFDSRFSRNNAAQPQEGSL